MRIRPGQESIDILIRTIHLAQLGGNHRELFCHNAYIGVEVTGAFLVVYMSRCDKLACWIGGAMFKPGLTEVGVFQPRD